MQTLLGPAAALAGGGGGGGGISASLPSSATSGPAVSGGGGVTFGSVNIGSSTNWWLVGGIAVGVLILWKPIKKLLHL